MCVQVRYRDIEKLDTDVLNRLLHRSVVHETIDDGRVRHLSIGIRFNFKQMPDVESYQPQERRQYFAQR